MPRKLQPTASTLVVTDGDASFDTAAEVSAIVQLTQPIRNSQRYGKRPYQPSKRYAGVVVAQTNRETKASLYSSP